MDKNRFRNISFCAIGALLALALVQAWSLWRMYADRAEEFSRKVTLAMNRAAYDDLLIGNRRRTSQTRTSVVTTGNIDSVKLDMIDTISVKSLGAAGKVLSIINTPEVLAGVAQRHQWFVDGLTAINQQYDLFSDIRGAGMLIGCQLTAAYAGQAKAITNAAAEEGLLALIAGPDVVRFAPSLIISEADVQEGLARFARALAHVVKR